MQALQFGQAFRIIPTLESNELIGAQKLQAQLAEKNMPSSIAYNASERTYFVLTGPEQDLYTPSLERLKAASKNRNRSNACSATMLEMTAAKDAHQALMKKLGENADTLEFDQSKDALTVRASNEIPAYLNQ
ncbi:MAG: hypothetical protein K2X66_16705 [Cyanobacteria bacterium]|nr:hypothetical protein [Cyanobacteriota bacterium]